MLCVISLQICMASGYYIMKILECDQLAGLMPNSVALPRQIHCAAKPTDGKPILPKSGLCNDSFRRLITILELYMYCTVGAALNYINSILVSTLTPSVGLSLIW